jgi:hypothetical protein
MCTGVHRYSYSPAPTPNPNPNNIVEYRTTSSPSLDGVIAANARTTSPDEAVGAAFSQGRGLQRRPLHG